MRTNPRPTASSIAFYYPPHYGPHHARIEKFGEDVPEPASAWRRVWHLLRETDPRQVPQISPGALLEIGCANGAYLHRMACRGWRVTGIESSENAALAARSLGYTVYTRNLEAEIELSDRYDLV